MLNLDRLFIAFATVVVLYFLGSIAFSLSSMAYNCSVN